ncbi:hypothetical protein [Streptomyces sp. NPDC002845]
MTPARRAAAPLLRCSLLSAALFTLSACGIATTGVVEAGQAATGVTPTTLLYFVGDGTSLVAVPRTSTDPVDAEKAVAMLLDGPTDLELVDGLTTELPGFPVELLPPDPDAAPAPTQTSLAMKVRTEGDTVSIEMPQNLRSPLSRTATDQLICTAAIAHLITSQDIDSAKVTVTGRTDTGRWSAEGSSTACPTHATPVRPNTESPPATLPEQPPVPVPEEPLFR